MNSKKEMSFVDFSKIRKEKTSSFELLKNSKINKQNEKSDIDLKKSKSNSYADLYQMSKSEEDCENEKNKTSEFDDFSVIEVESNVEQR